MGVAHLQAADVFDIHAVRRVVVGDRHAFEGSDGFFGENLVFRSVYLEGFPIALQTTFGA